MAADADILAAAEQARIRADWEGARALYARALDHDPDDPDALDGLGMTVGWLSGGWKQTIELRSRAYAGYRRRGDVQRAGGIAVALAEESRIEGLRAAANGWLGRAERLLEEAGECVERGWLAIERAKQSQSPAVRERRAQEALDIAQGLGDRDLEVAALAHLGLARTMAGDVGGGMEVLDEAMAAATGGEATDPLAIGETCCMTLVACERWSDFERAAEWCRVVIEFSERRNYMPLAAWCRTIYAGVLTTLGDWPRAESELVAALAQYDQLEEGRRMYALTRLADLRIRQGRVEDAERLLEGHTEDPSAVTAMAAVDLERGEAELASERIAERVRELPPDDPEQGVLLPLLVRARLLQDDPDAAADVVERMRELSRTLHRQHLLGLAELAAAEVSAACRDGAAGAHARVARDIFVELGMPLEAARARLEQARHHASAGSPLAVPEARAALESFERLGAARHADSAAHLLRTMGAAGRNRPRPAGELTSREHDVLDLLAAGLSNVEIAERLFITTKTVEHHVGRVLAKLGLRNRTEAAAYRLRGEGTASRS